MMVEVHKRCSEERIMIASFGDPFKKKKKKGNKRKRIQVRPRFEETLQPFPGNGARKSLLVGGP